MKPLLFLILIAFSITCCKETTPVKTTNIVVSENTPIVIDSIEVLKKDLVLNGNKGQWYYK